VGWGYCDQGTAEVSAAERYFLLDCADSVAASHALSCSKAVQAWSLAQRCLSPKPPR